MTRVACAMLLNFSTARLCWRSIKALKPTEQKSAAVSLDYDFDVDPEIPKLWCLVAFHALYAGTIEWLISWLPLYYYVKLVLLTATFVPGTKFPAYWFDCWLVPSLDKVHVALDFDWGQYCLDAARLLPFLLIDVVFAPGLLSGDISDDRGDRGSRGDAAVVPGPVILSPLHAKASERSRVVASSMQLQSFSRKHVSPSKSPRFAETKNTPVGKNYLQYDEGCGEAVAGSSVEGRRYRRRRKSVNEKMRSLVCGSPNIRIRDYLFDLDLPSFSTTIANDTGFGESPRVPFSVDRGGEARERSRKAESRRRRKTFAGVVRREQFLGEQGGVHSDASVINRASDETACSAPNVTNRRSKRIANRTKSR